jgi:sugar phosphate permease
VAWELISQITSVPKSVRGVFYGWWLVPLTGFIKVLTSVPLFHAMTVWSVALESHFGWSRTQLSLAFTLTRVEGGIMGPVEGYLTDRLGTRRIVLIGLLVLGGGFLLFWQVRSLGMFYLAFVVMSLGHSLAGWVPVTTVLNNWFARRRTVAIGWANTIDRLGGLFLVPAIAWAIDPDQDRLGWQLTALILGLFTLAIAFPICRLIRNRPEEYNLRPDGDSPTLPIHTTPQRTARAKKGSTHPQAMDFTSTQALKTPAFWYISFGHGFTSMVILAILVHLGLFINDKGFDVQTTAWVVAVYTAVSMVAQIAGGYLGDRLPKRMILFGFTSIQAGAVILLTFSSSLFMLYLFAVLFGIGFGGRNPLTTAIRGEYFGRASFGKILGLSTVPMNVLLLVAAPLAGYLYDVQGTYTMAFIILAALNFLGGVLFLMARRPTLAFSAQRHEVVAH